MKIETVDGSLMTQITDFRNEPMKYFDLVKREKEEIYVMKNNSMAGVIIDKETFDGMLERINELQNKILYLNVEKRINEIDSGKPVLLNEAEVLNDHLDIHS